MCPFTSIKEVVKHLASTFAQFFVADRFRNIDNIKYVVCPTFFLHGLKDTLIPYKHSIDLMTNCQGMTSI